MDDQVFHQRQIAQFKQLAEQLAAAAELPGNDNLALLSEQYEALAADSAALLDEGPALIHRLMTAAPGLATLVPRDLLWYLGGECLHFMPDEEIEQFNALDEDRRSAADRGLRFDWSGAVASSRTLQ